MVAPEASASRIVFESNLAPYESARLNCYCVNHKSGCTISDHKDGSAEKGRFGTETEV